VNEGVIVRQRPDQFVVFQERHQFLNRTGSINQPANRSQMEVTVSPRDLAGLFDLVATILVTERKQPTKTGRIWFGF
tara:strand:- start:983 stop:1213 length:231 start_codon:yes stop_codon:yes gene_type:complete